MHSSAISEKKKSPFLLEQVNRQKFGRKRAVVESVQAYRTSTKIKIEKFCLFQNRRSAFFFTVSFEVACQVSRKNFYQNILTQLILVYFKSLKIIEIG